jgi:hypothetical protein
LYLLACLCVAATCFCICFMAAGSLGSKILAEVGDVGSAVGSLNQSYTLTGAAVHPNEPTAPELLGPGGGGAVTERAGSSFTDTADFCDQGPSCGIRTCIPAIPEAPGGGG